MNPASLLFAFVFAASAVLALSEGDFDKRVVDSDLDVEKLKNAQAELEVKLKDKVGEAVKTLNEVFGQYEVVQKKAFLRALDAHRRSVTRRGWSDFWGGAAAAATTIAILGRDESNNAPAEREINKVTERETLDRPSRKVTQELTGRFRRASEVSAQRRPVTKRGWKSFLAGAAAVALVGRDEANRRTVPDREPNVQKFKDDVAKVKDALDLLNGVVAVAELQQR